MLKSKIKQTQHQEKKIRKDILPVSEAKGRSLG